MVKTIDRENWEEYFKMEEINMEMKMSVEEAKDLSKTLMQRGYH